MFHRIGHAGLIVALVAAIGGHWTLLQTVAWTNMLAQNLETSSFSEALTKTFDGKHPCRMCRQIAAEKKSEKKADLPTPAKQFEFTHLSSRFIFAAPSNFWLQAQALANLSSVTLVPPVPPPRSLPG